MYVRGGRYAFGCMVDDVVRLTSAASAVEQRVVKELQVRTAAGVVSVRWGTASSAATCGLTALAGLGCATEVQRRKRTVSHANYPSWQRGVDLASFAGCQLPQLWRNPASGMLLRMP